MRTKHLRVILLTAMMCLLGSSKASAYDFEEDGIYYNVLSETDKTLEVTYGLYDYTGDVSIPSSVNGYGVEYKVTSIGSSAFIGCSGLTSVNIPNSVTEIGNSAFAQCSGLTSVNIPNSVTDIGLAAFSGCSGLTSINIPNSVTEIGDLAFQGCSGLTTIQVESGNTHFDSRENCNAIIETARNSLVIGCKNTVIPNSVTKILGNAFSGCSSLTSMTIPNSVTEIGGGAFEDCTGLTSINIPNSVTEIQLKTFNGCSGLTSVSIPNSVIFIYPQAFGGCSGLTSVNIPNSVIFIESWAFFKCIGLTSVNIPNSVTHIGAYAFNGCSGLTSVTIPNSVKNIFRRAFEDCSGLTSIYILATTPPNLGEYKYEAFPEQAKIDSESETPCTIYIPNGTRADYEKAGYDIYRLEEKTLTGIEQATQSKTSNAPIYDIQGRQILTQRKGQVYIENGRKMIK